MKIIAIMGGPMSSPYSCSFMVEMTGSEFESVTGKDPMMGATADVAKDWSQLRSLQRQAEASKRAAEGFRALAEMTDMMSAQFAKVVGAEAVKEAT